MSDHHHREHGEHARGHDHDHPPDHGQGHSHAPASFGRAFAVGIALNTLFVIVEVVYGLFAHSLALVADAGHNLGDVLGLFLAWGATIWARRTPTARHTYGWRRSSVLAALANAIFLLLTVGVIAWEAVQRLREPAPVAAQAMIWVSAIGIVINTATALMFMSGRKGDLNIRGAFQHMAADAVISAGVVVAGVIIVFTHWVWLDPMVSLALVAVIVAGTWDLLRDSFHLALDAIPAGIDPGAVREYLLGLPGVIDAHHLHIWGLSTTEAALTVHLVLKEGPTDDGLLHKINHELAGRFRIGHATIQFESASAGECHARECHCEA